MGKRVLLVGVGVAMIVIVCACRNSSLQSVVMPETLTPEVSLVSSEATAIGTATNMPTATDRPNETPMATVMPASTPAVTDIATATLTATDTATATPTATSTPFFPLGFMGPADETQFPHIAAAGFNVVFEFRSVQEIDEAEDYLNRAQAVGLKVIQNMPSCRAYESSNPVCEEWNAHVWSEAEWGEFISPLATHDNLVAWFLPDEIVNYAAAADLYRWVKAYDPHQRPVYGNPGTFELAKIARFPTFSDFQWAACYPEYYQEPRAIVTYGMKLDAMVSQGTDIRWGAILQFFDSAEFGRGGGHPTAHELRADSYQAIIAGATGLWYFSYDLGRDMDGLWEATVTIADEIIGLGGLDEVILSPAVPQKIVKTIVSGPSHSPPTQGEVYDSIQMLQKEHNGTYLFAVNIAADGVVVEFSNLPVEAVAVEVLFENRTIFVSDGSFQDSFAQDDVHIYHVITGI